MQTYTPELALISARREFGEHGGVAPSISRSATFTVVDPHTLPEIFKGAKGPEKGGCFLYSRHFNPTVSVLGRYLAAMEGTEACMCTASGMSAIACTLLQLCKQGDHIVSSDTIYGGTHAFLADLLPRFGIQTTFVDITSSAKVEAAICKETKVIYTESMGNPTLKIADIPTLSKLAHANSLKLVVDNTFAPMVLSPAQMGADVVVYSMTKFINGASDLIAGAVCSSTDFIKSLMDLHQGMIMLLGPTMDPRVAFDIIQRLPHLPLRMREHSRRAMAMARMLEEMNMPVIYPGLESHPQHNLLQSMINRRYGHGGIIAIDCKTLEKAEQFLDILQNKEKFGLIAVSLGYFDTLMSCSGTSTSSEIPQEEQRQIGLSPGLVRLAVGYTGTLEARLAQLKKAAETVLTA